VTRSGLTSEPIRVIAESVAAYSGQSLIEWTSRKYGRPQSYTLAALANQLQVNIEGKRRTSAAAVTLVFTVDCFVMIT